MIVSLYGKDVLIRRNAAKYVRELGAITNRLYKDTVSIEELRSLAEAESLFGDTAIVYVENSFSEIQEQKEKEELLTLCKESKNIFIFDELEEEAGVKKELIKWSEHFFDGASEKKKREFPSALCDALKRRDKKTAWSEYVKVRDGESELLHGAILWQMKMLWNDALAGKSLPYTASELAEKNRELVIMFHEAHRGNVDFKNDMERWVLSL